MKAAIDKDKHWYVVRTNVKAEVKASENIRNVGYDVYFPRSRMEVKNKRTHTFTTRESPLMSRYLFVGLPQGDRNFFKVRGCDGVECILGVDGRPVRISADDIEAIYLAEMDMTFDDTRAARIHRHEEAKTQRLTTEMKFPKGFCTEVIDGPLVTLNAIVEEVTSRGTVKALVALFGRLSTAEFSYDQLSPAA